MKPRAKSRLIVLGAILLLLIGAATVSYVVTQSDKIDLNNVTNIKELVARHYKLPVDEEPALATVDDKTKLNSDFLRAAENGDKLLVYKNAKKAILYRPSIDRIIEVGPVSIASAEESGSN